MQLAAFFCMLAVVPIFSAQSEKYDAFQKVVASHGVDQQNALREWDSKYLAADFIDLWSQLRTNAPPDPSLRQILLDKADEVLKTNPENGDALFMICSLGSAPGRIGSNTTPSAELIAKVESAARALIDAQWKVPSQLAKAHAALAWVEANKKDLQGAENEYRQALTIDPDDGPTASQLGKVLFERKKYAEALFEYARAGQYEGPGPCLPPAGRQVAMDFFNKTYKSFFGSDYGKDHFLALARVSALPPRGLLIPGDGDQRRQD